MFTLLRQLARAARGDHRADLVHRRINAWTSDQVQLRRKVVELEKRVAELEERRAGSCAHPSLFAMVEGGTFCAICGDRVEVPA